MSLTALFPDVQAKYSPVEISPRYLRVLDTTDHVYVHPKTGERMHIDRCTRNELDHDKPIRFEDKGSPDVWNFEVVGERNRFVKLTDDVQYWMFRNMVEWYQGWRFANQAKFMDWLKFNRRGIEAGHFTSALRSNGSHTNKSGLGTMFPNVPPARNAIKQEDMENDFPKFWQIVTGRFVGLKASDTIKQIYGSPCVSFEVINISKGGYWDYSPFTHPHLFDLPMITGRDMVQDKSGTRILGHWRRPYGQFQNKLVFPVMAQNSDVGWIPLKWTKASEIKPLGKFG